MSRAMHLARFDQMQTNKHTAKHGAKKNSISHSWLIPSSKLAEVVQKKLFKSLTYPYHPSMVYLPTFPIKSNQM